MTSWLMSDDEIFWLDRGEIRGVDGIFFFSLQSLQVFEEEKKYKTYTGQQRHMLTCDPSLGLPEEPYSCLRRNCPSRPQHSPHFKTLNVLPTCSVFTTESASGRRVVPRPYFTWAGPPTWSSHWAASTPRWENPPSISVTSGFLSEEGKSK